MGLTACGETPLQEAQETCFGFIRRLFSSPSPPQTSRCHTMSFAWLTLWRLWPLDPFTTSQPKPLNWFSLEKKRRGCLGSCWTSLRALFRKKQAVAVKEESDKKEVKEDEGDVGEEEDCDNEEQELDKEEKEESKKDK